MGLSVVDLFLNASSPVYRDTGELWRFSVMEDTLQMCSHNCISKSKLEIVWLNFFPLLSGLHCMWVNTQPVCTPLPPWCTMESLWWWVTVRRISSFRQNTLLSVRHGHKAWTFTVKICVHFVWSQMFPAGYLLSWFLNPPSFLVSGFQACQWVCMNTSCSSCVLACPTCSHVAWLARLSQGVCRVMKSLICLQCNFMNKRLISHCKHLSIITNVRLKTDYIVVAWPKHCHH